MSLCDGKRGGFPRPSSGIDALKLLKTGLPAWRAHLFRDGKCGALRIPALHIGVMLGQLRVRVGRLPLLEATGLMNQVALRLRACVSPKPDTFQGHFYDCKETVLFHVILTVQTLLIEFPKYLELLHYLETIVGITGT